MRSTIPSHNSRCWRSTGKKIDATKGGKDALAFEAPPLPVDKPPPPPPPPPKDEHPRQEAKSEKPFGPLVFFIGAGLTVVAGGLTVWSGIDTQNSPGTDAVRRDCAGKDTSCPTYQEGKDKELRTNVLIGATIGLGVITGVVGLFFTQWSHDERVGLSSRGLTVRF